MNIYSLISLLILFLVVGHVFDLGASFKELFQNLANVPRFTDKGSNPAMYDLVVRMMYLIVVVGIFRIIFNRTKNDE